MNCSRRISAFTLVELLAVLVIVGVMLVLSGGISRRSRDTFISQQYVKTTLQNARTLRRKSMLISKNDSDEKWVHAIGFRFEKSLAGQWSMKQIKVLSNTVGTGFYEGYPSSDPPCLQPISVSGTCPLQWAKIDGTTEPTLISSVQIVASAQLNSSNRIDCTRSLTVLYESINGNVHLYCSRNNNPTENPIEDPLPYTQVEVLNAQVKLTYTDKAGEFYGYYLDINKNGEIDSKKL